MKHGPAHLIRSCAACRALDGAASDTPPHKQAVYDTSRSVRPEEPGAGRVLHYHCSACGMHLRRFTQACALDGWLVVPAEFSGMLSDCR